MHFKKRFVANDGTIITTGAFFTTRQNSLICGILSNNKQEGFGFELKANGIIVCACYKENKLVNSFELPLRLNSNDPKLRQKVAAYLLGKANPVEYGHCANEPLTTAMSHSLDRAMSVDPELAASKCIQSHKRFVDYALYRLNRQLNRE